MTLEEMKKLPEKEQKELFNRIKEIRNLAKVVNFSSIYGAGPAKIASTTGMALNKAKTLHKAYWDLNWAVKKIASDSYYKVVDNQMWIYNPISGFYYSLRYEKDKFSTLNQGTGVFCFDNFVRQVREKGYKMCGQFHDEIIFAYKKEDTSKVEADLQDSISKVNERLRLNVKLGISVQSGKAYNQIH